MKSVWRCLIGFEAEIFTLSLKHLCVCVVLAEFCILVLFEGDLPGLGWLLSPPPQA